MIWKILGLFVYTLIADDKYSLLNREFIATSSDAIISGKKHTPNISFDFSNLDSNLNIFTKKVTLIAVVFSILRSPKNVVR